jgi:hypothetical protein
MPFYSSSMKNVSNSISSVVNDKKSDKMNAKCIWLIYPFYSLSWVLKISFKSILYYWDLCFILEIIVSIRTKFGIFLFSGLNKSFKIDSSLEWPQKCLELPIF